MTVERLESAVVLIRGGDSTSFGTAFAVHQDATGTYLVTCAHVLEDLEVGKIKIRDYPVAIVARGRKEDFDIAVLHVAGQLEYPVLTTCVADLKSGAPFLTGGFYALGDQKVAETFEGTLDKAIRVESPDRGSVLGWYISLSPSVVLQRGSSGAPLMHRDTGLVIGIITHKLGESRGVALSLEALEKIWTAAPPGLLDTIEGHEKRRLLLELLQGLPAAVPDVPGFQSLSQIRSDLAVKSISGHAAFDAVATIVAGTTVTLAKRIESTEEKILKLKNLLEEVKEPLRKLEAQSEAFYNKLSRLTLKIRDKVQAETESVFDLLAEDARRSCKKFLEENRPPLFTRNRYLLDLEEAVNRELMGRLEVWKRSFLPKIAAEVEKDLTGILVEVGVSMSNMSTLDSLRPELVSEGSYVIDSGVRLSIGTPAAGLVALYLLQLVTISSKDRLARAGDLMAKEVIGMGPKVADSINLKIREEIQNVSKRVAHICEQKRQEIMVGITAIEQQIDLNKGVKAEAISWQERIVNIKKQLEGRTIGSTTE